VHLKSVPDIRGPQDESENWSVTTYRISRLSIQPIHKGIVAYGATGQAPQLFFSLLSELLQRTKAVWMWEI
jgi:hypothetical protein